ncbi:MAG: tripartite tricarboxylate transporter substrate binding protein [Betaproteobacteria bacterium]|nr:tripartite tricarboxylate transporter substrate binding protein [Betaproteobacteria bacterium]
MPKKHLLGSLLLCCALVQAASAPAALLERHAEGPFPNRPIRLVVTFPPGGGTDTLARILGVQLGEIWREQVVIDNRPGASGNIGAEIVARSASDGYTLLMVNSTFAMNAGLYSKLKFDSVRDFTAIARVASTSGIVAVHPSLAVGSIKELIAAARTRPGKIAYSSCGSGTPQHLSGELLKFLAKIELIHVPYKGCAPALADGLAGQVPVIFNTVPNVLPHARAGRLRALAVTSGKRFALEPDLHTVAEAGLEGYDVDQWFAVLGPSGIPQPIVATLNREIVRIVAAPALREKLIAQYFVPAPSTPEQMTTIVRQDIARWAKLIKQVGIRVD